MSDEYNEIPSDHNLIHTELQVRLMNLVLGEASDFERDQLQLLMEQRPELAAYCKHLAHLHGLLSEVGAGEPSNDVDSAMDVNEWRLPADRREQVLAVLENRISNPPPKVTLANQRSFRNWRTTTMEAIVVASIACVILGLMLPATQSAREAGQLSNRGGTADSFRMAEMAPAAVPAKRAIVGKALNTVQSASETIAPSALTNDLYSRPNNSTGEEITRELSRVSNGTTAMARSSNGSGVPGQTLPSPSYLSDDVQYFPASPENKLASESPMSGTLDGLAVQEKGQRYGEKQLAESVFSRFAMDGEDQMGRQGATASKPSEVVAPSVPSNAAPLEPIPSISITPNYRYIQPGAAAPAFTPDLDLNGALDAVEAIVDAPLLGQQEVPYTVNVPPVIDRDVKSYTVSVPEDGTILLGGIKRNREENSEKGTLNRFFKNDVSDTNTLMMTVTPRIIIPEEEEEILGVNLSATSPEIASSDRAESPEPSLDIKHFGYPLTNRLNPNSTKELVIKEVQPGVPFDLTEEVNVAIEVDRLKSSIAKLQSDLSTSSMARKTSRSLESAPSPELAANGRDRANVESKPTTLKQPVALDEQSASAEAFSTFSLHVSDVSFKLAQAALSQSQWPEPAKIRIEEFVNALDYHDPLPSGDQKIACRVEQAIHPFLMQRNLLRVSMRTAAAGRSQNTPLRLTLLLDNSGSMERADRRQAVLRAFQTLTQQLKATDQISLISFASSPRLLADKVPGNQGATLLQLIETLPSEGGTNIESALQLAREKAAEQQVAGAQNRIVLLTDGAVNLGDANPENLARQVTQMRDAGIAFDAAGISAQDLNDEVLEALTRQGDGRYYLLDSAESASESFAAQIAGSLRPSAQNVKVQVEFNPLRVGRYKLLGYEKHRLNKEDFRNDQVDAAEMAAAEAGVAVYQYEIKPKGSGDVGSVSVRFRDLSTGQMVERRWPILYESNTPRLEQAQPSMQLAAVAALFAAKLGGGPLADSVDMAQLQKVVAKLPEQFASQPRVQQLRAMIEQAIAIH